MKRYLLIIFTTIAITGCKKTVTTNVIANPYPSYVIEGLSDMSFTNYEFTSGTMTLKFDYTDSVQQYLTLSLSGLPNGITIDTSWIKTGLVPFTDNLIFYDTVAGGTIPGIYPVTLTVTTNSGEQRSFSFKMHVNPMPTAFLGKYVNCSAACVAGITYTDSLYIDPIVKNKLWFSNFNNTGHAGYGYILSGNGGEGAINIPPQTIGDTTYATTEPSYINITGHISTIDLYLSSGATSHYCEMILR